MPIDGDEVCLTELETSIMSVFIKAKILDDAKIVETLASLAFKLDKHHTEKGVY